MTPEQLQAQIDELESELKSAEWKLKHNENYINEIEDENNFLRHKIQIIKERLIIALTDKNTVSLFN